MCVVLMGFDAKGGGGTGIIELLSFFIKWDGG